MSTLPDSGYPASGGNRSRAEVQASIADMVGGSNKPDIKAVIDRAWDAAVRDFNTVPWAFTRVQDDIVIDSTMKAATAPPTVASTGSGVGFVLESGRTVTYWIEERIKVGSRVLQRNDAQPPGGQPQIVTLVGSGAVVKPVVTRPTQVNPNATHWALFATQTSGSSPSSDGAFPHAYEVGEADIATTTIEDQRTGINPGQPPNSAIYQSGEYDLSAPFRSPVRALALDGSGQTRYILTWVPWRDWTQKRPWQITTGSNPIWYTARNWYRNGKITFDPRPGTATTYPMIRLTYDTYILPAQGADARLDVPAEIDNAIFEATSLAVRRNILGRDAVGPDELREMQERYYELEIQWRDHPDY